MSTIVEYTDTAPPENHFPERIVSPSHSDPCCFGRMELLGNPQTEGHYVYQYKRCTCCGFAVRAIIQLVPDQEAIVKVRELLKNFSPAERAA